MGTAFRDLKGWEAAGLPVSTPSNEAAKLYDTVLTQYVTWCTDPSLGDIESNMKKLVEADPEFVMGHVICCGIQLLGTGTTAAINPDLTSNLHRMVALAEKGSITDRERRHVQAVKLWSQDDLTSATDIWEDILLCNPSDMLALKMAHDSYFYLGQAVKLRDSIARVLPSWTEDIPLYGYLHGMYAFGLEETNFYREAEKHAEKGLQLNPNDCWSTHAKVHVIEMEGRQSDGIKFLERTEANWQKGVMLACHNYWHWALYHIEKGEYEAALDIFDKQVGERCKSKEPLDLVDAASLLYRLEMEGFSVGERWKDVCSHYICHFDDHVLAFNDVHAIMATLGAKDNKATSKLMDSLRNYTREGGGSNRRVSKEIGFPMCEAFQAYDKGDFDKAVEILYPLRYRVVEIGGSHAQRDIFNQFLIHSALQSTQNTHRKLARVLLAERKACKERSPLTDRLMAKALALHTD